MWHGFRVENSSKHVRNLWNLIANWNVVGSEWNKLADNFDTTGIYRYGIMMETGCHYYILCAHEQILDTFGMMRHKIQMQNA